eukprot:358362-Lingulodinium_polyedra.AAC.1
MLRSNAFAGSRSRTMKSQASPDEVYNVVNIAVAQHLAKEGLQFPTFSACVAAFTVSQGGLSRAGGRARRAGHGKHR